MTKHVLKLILPMVLFAWHTGARECRLPSEWQELCRILNARVAQKQPKMKLEDAEASSLETFLRETKADLPNLNALKTILPKTTLELLMAIHKRGLSAEESELMAAYLKDLTAAFQFQNVGAFDNNTSHIIGREWHEIDYTGEGMTWKKQRAKYAPYGITHFKSLDCLEKFFPVEARLPYFRTSYKPRHPRALDHQG
ncbi:MAG: hypothetical protein K2Y18_04215 [Alphaproteobacteria bacterium]|jgi:hypothetical protein|nr:hypothetical protein [Alphaproteobacteria bacterium]